MYGDCSIMKNIRPKSIVCNIDSILYGIKGFMHQFLNFQL